MIVKQVQISDVFALETENKAPVAGDPDRPLTAPVTLELVQPRARQMPDLYRTRRGSERSQQYPEFCRVTLANTARVPGAEEPLQPFVPDVEDHGVSVT